MMNISTLIFIFAIFVSRLLAAEKGKDYPKEKICDAFRTIGVNNYRIIVTAIYSQKFPNGTYDEVSSLAEEMTKLAEECCQENASPDCYDKGVTKTSDRSCEKSSPFPKHPDTEQCCVHVGDKRKLCLVKLRYSADELPSLLEPTPEEICTQFKHNASRYSLRYAYEFARRHQYIPAGFVFNATQSHVKMAEDCCTPNVSNPCFFKERYSQRDSNIFLRFISNVCKNQVNLKSYKNGLTAYFGTIMKIPFEDALALSKHFQSGLAKCCLQSQPKCIVNEFNSFYKHLCNDSTTDNMSEGLQKCCSKAPFDALTCMDNLKRHSRDISDTSQNLSAQLCDKAQPDIIDRYLFQIGVKHVSVSMPVLTTFQDQMRKSVAVCCSGSDDATICLKKEESKLVTELLSKIEDFCSKRFKLELPAFKLMLEQEFQREEQSQSWIDLTTSCCSQHSPAKLCQKLTEAVIKTEEDSKA